MDFCVFTWREVPSWCWISGWYKATMVELCAQDICLRVQISIAYNQLTIWIRNQWDRIGRETQDHIFDGNYRLSDAICKVENCINLLRHKAGREKSTSIHQSKCVLCWQNHNQLRCWHRNESRRRCLSNAMLSHYAILSPQLSQNILGVNIHLP